MQPVERICEAKHLSSTAKLVWLLVLAKLERDGKMPAVPELAAALGYTPRATHYALRELYESGELTRGAYRYLGHSDDPIGDCLPRMAMAC
jgi:hypothetical protein